MRLYVSEYGCYHDEMHYEGKSDMQNFRICCEVFDTKDRPVVCEFAEGAAGKWKGRLCASISYKDEHSNWWRVDHGRDYGIDSADYEYSREGVLQFVNAITGESYDEIVPFMECKANGVYVDYTGSGIMAQWVRQMNQMEKDDTKLINSFGSTFIIFRGKVWDYEKVLFDTYDPFADKMNVVFQITRVTDTEREQRILANACVAIGKEVI